MRRRRPAGSGAGLPGLLVVDDPLGDLAHRLAQVHGGLLDPAEGLGLGHAEGLLEDALRLVDGLAGGEALLERGDLVVERDDLGEAGEGDLDGGDDVGGVEGLHDVGHRPGLAGLLDQLPLAERGEHDACGDAVPGDLLGRGDPVHDGHVHIEHDDIGLELAGLLDRGLPVAHLADDLVALLGEELDEVEPDERLVLGDENTGPLVGRCGAVGLLDHHLSIPVLSIPVDRNGQICQDGTARVARA